LGLLGTLEPWAMQQIDHVDIFITYLCLALVHYRSSRMGAHRTSEILPDQSDELLVHLYRLVPFLQTNPKLTTRAVRDLAAADNKLKQGCARIYYDYVNPYQMTPLRRAGQVDRARGYPDSATDT
jgi:hypothetical protein